MKKILITIILMTVCGICMAKPKVIYSKPCEYREVKCNFYGYENCYKDEITYTQAIKDLDMLVYLIKSSYAGYDDAIENGLKIDEIISLFEDAFSKNENIEVSELCDFICKFLTPYMQDSHFCIQSKNFSRVFINGYRILYSNVYVKKDGSTFIIEKSDSEDFQLGDSFECSNENLLLYPSEGKNIYRIGTYALLDENEKRISVICAEKEKKLNCSIANDYLYSSDNTQYKEIESRDSIYIYIPTLMDVQNSDSRKQKIDENFNKFLTVSQRYLGKKNIILDLRTNAGGNSLHASGFLANLYFSEKKCNERNSDRNLKKEQSLLSNDKEYIISPATIQAEKWLGINVFSKDKILLNFFNERRKLLNKRNVRIKYREHKHINNKQTMPNFHGKLIILSGKNSCSSSEDTILEARKLFSGTNQFIQIGENSAGCFAYGNVWCYQLENSGIVLHLPVFKNGSSEICPEGFGFEPDYWATNEDIVKAIVNVTEDNELSEKLDCINNNL